jgi:hypothetical protein
MEVIIYTALILGVVVGLNWFLFRLFRYIFELFVVIPRPQL